MSSRVRISLGAITAGLLAIAGIGLSHRAGTSREGAAGASSGVTLGAKSGEQDRNSRSRSRNSGQKFDRGTQIDAAIEQSIALNPNLPLLNGRGITSQGASTLGLDEAEVAAINAAYKKTRLAWLDELETHLKQIPAGEKGDSVEYRVDASSTAIADLKNAFTAEITQIAGAKLAELSVKTFEVDPEFLGFGKYDLYFRIDHKSSEEGTPKGNDAGWTIYHEERLLGSSKVASFNTWRMTDFSNTFGIFQAD